MLTFPPVVLGVNVGVVAATFISLKVFHWPQAGHLPIHFGDSCPQLEHTYAVLSFAIVVKCYSATKLLIIFVVTKLFITFAP
jgi:hypothetical protein